MRRSCRQFVATLGICLFAATPAVSGQFEDGMLAFDRGAYSAAMQIWHPLAVAGDARAQHRIASLYGMGAGVQRDDAQVVIWMRRAAERGLATAQSRLGFMYEFGERVSSNYTQALRWYRAAALQGDEFAAGRLNLINDVSRRIAKR